MAVEHLSAPPVFLLSCERSGSTLLRYILDTHPEVCSPGELHLGGLCDSLHRAVRLTQGKVAKTARAEERELLVLAEVRRIVSELMETYAAAKGKRMWCEKTPRNLQSLEIIGKVFPRAKYICLYRNCLDVVHSLIERIKDGYMLDLVQYARNYGPRNHLDVLVDNWVDKTGKMLAHERAQPDRCFRVKYEELVLNPAATLEPLFEFLGVSWDASLLDTIFTTQHDTGLGDTDVIFSKRVHSNSVGTGSAISPGRISEGMTARANALLADLGYPAIGADAGSGMTSRRVAADAAVQTRADDEVVSSAQDIFAVYVPQRLKERGRVLREERAVYKIELTGEEGGAWIIDGRREEWRVTEGEGEADCTIIVSPADMIEMINGRLNAAKAFRNGRVRITGDIRLATRLGEVLFRG